ncbi:MAG TPA: hypothetical protein VLD67_00155 [Vicinamibacterales bacterium]|nr:hypothetical protein [Vicinamibacterales bacterium]
MGVDVARLSHEIASLPLVDAHRVLTLRAEGVLPFTVQEEAADA